VSGFTAFVFVFVFKCRSRKRFRGFPTVFIPRSDGEEEERWILTSCKLNLNWRTLPPGCLLTWTEPQNHFLAEPTSFPRGEQSSTARHAQNWKPWTLLMHASGLHSPSNDKAWFANNTCCYLGTCSIHSNWTSDSFFRMMCRHPTFEIAMLWFHNLHYSISTFQNFITSRNTGVYI